MNILRNQAAGDLCAFDIRTGGLDAKIGDLAEMRVLLGKLGFKTIPLVTPMDTGRPYNEKDSGYGDTIIYFIMARVQVP